MLLIFLAHVAPMLRARVSARRRISSRIAATSTVPIVIFGGDPVSRGLATSLAHPDGNVTGVVILVAELDAKRLDFLHEAVPAALAFMADLGWDRVRTHNRALAAYGRDVVARALGTEPPILPGLDGLVEAMTLVALPPGVAETEDAAVALRLRIADELGIEALPLAWNGRGYLRLSAQVYNAPADYERLAEGLPGLLARTSPSN